jgi:hypothetical protein
MSGRLPGLEGFLVIHWRHHGQRGVAPVVVVIVDPCRDPGARLRFGGEVLDGAQCEFQGGVPGLDDGVIPRRQLRPIPFLPSESCG